MNRLVALPSDRLDRFNSKACRLFALVAFGLLNSLVFSACAITERGGVQRMCDAPLDCPDCMGYDDTMVQTMLAAHIDSGLYNSAAREVFINLAMQDGPSKGRFLREAASAAGIERCAWADVFDQGLLGATMEALRSETENCKKCQTWKLVFERMGKGGKYDTYSTISYPSKEECDRQAMANRRERVPVFVDKEKAYYFGSKGKGCECRSDDEETAKRKSTKSRLINERVAITRDALGDDWDLGTRWKDQPVMLGSIGDYNSDLEKVVVSGLPELEAAQNEALQACGVGEKTEEGK